MGKIRTTNRRAKRRLKWVGASPLRCSAKAARRSPAHQRHLDRYGRDWFAAKHLLLRPRTPPF